MIVKAAGVTSPGALSTGPQYSVFNMARGPETQSWEELRFTVTSLENRAGPT